MIVVDTSVWSMALRRQRDPGSPPPAARLLQRLIEERQPIVLLGIVKQELLSGLRHQPQFERLQDVLDPFSVLLAEERDHTEAARLVNFCRSCGVQVGTVDALIIAMTTRLDGVLLTTDKDFKDIQEHSHFGLWLLPVS